VNTNEKIRRAIQAFARDLDALDSMIADAADNLAALANSGRAVLDDLVATFPAQPGRDLLSDGKALDQIANHAEQIRRIVDEIGEPGRRVLRTLCRGQREYDFELGGRRFQTTDGWPGWPAGDDTTAFKRHVDEFLAPLVALRDRDYSTVNLGDERRDLAVRVIRAIESTWRGAFDAAPTPAQLRAVAPLVLGAIEPGMARNIDEKIRQARP